MSDRAYAEASTGDHRTIAELIDGHAMSRLQLLVVGLVTLVLVFDGLSLQILGYATPSILADWQVTKVELSPAVGFTVFGMAAGTLIGGRLGDWLGRKPVLVGAVFLFGFADIGCAVAGDVQTLTIMRFVSGLAFGACFPNAAALVAEWTPRRAISQAVGIMTVGVPIGGIVGALVAMLVLNQWGWQGSFIVGGFLSLALGVAILLLMPESPGWLAKRGASPKLDALLMRAWPRSAASWTPSTAERPRGTPSGETKLLTRANVRTNVALWLGFATNTFVAIALLSWGTTALTSLGVGLQTAISFAIPYNIASIVLTVGAAVAAARYGTRTVVILLAIGASLALGFAAFLGNSGAPPIAAIGALYIAAGGFIGGVQGLLFVMAANAYPVEYRSTGVGACSAIGRVGGIASAFGGGAILSSGTPAAFFASTSGVMLLIIVSAVLANRHVAPRPKSA